MKKANIVAIAASACLGWGATAAQAGFLGHSVEMTEYAGDTFATASVPNDLQNFGTRVVVDGVELYTGTTGCAPCQGTGWTVDISDTRISLINNTGGPFNFGTSSPFLVDSFFDVFATIDPISSVSLNSTSSADLDASRVLFDADHVYLNVANVGVPDGFFVILDVQFAEAPVPATAALLVLGLGMLGWTRGRARAV